VQGPRGGAGEGRFFVFGARGVLRILKGPSRAFLFSVGKPTENFSLAKRFFFAIIIRNLKISDTF
jgi:hypothetical protein